MGYLYRSVDVMTEQLQRSLTDLECIVADLRRSEATLSRTNRVLKALSACRRAMLRATDEAGLLRQVCHALVEDGGCRAAWITGIGADSGRWPMAAASAGHPPDPAGLTTQTAGGDPIASAARTGEPCVARVLSGDDDAAMVLALPLDLEREVVGVLAVSATEASAFAGEELPLFEELAADVACGVGRHRERRARAEADAGVLASERRFRALIERSPDGISLLAEDGTILYDSDSTTALLGYTPTERLGRQGSEFVHPDDRAGLTTAFARLVRQPGAFVTCQARLVRRDGTARWIEGVFTNRLHEPAIEAVVVNYRDITEQRRAEEALRASERRYASILAATNEGVFDWDLTGATTRVSDRWLDLYGLPRESTPNTDAWRARVHPQDLPRVDQSFDDYMEGKTPISECEYRIRDAQGEERWVRGRALAMRDPDGRPVRVYGTVADISERKRAELALQESESRFRQVVECSPMPIGISDPSGRIDYLNPRFQEVFGYRAEELPHVEHWFERAYPDPDYRRKVVDQWQEAIADAVRQQRPSEVLDVHIVCRDGSVRIMQVFAAIMDDRLLAVFNDLTDRIRAEDALRQSEERFAVFMANLPAGAFMKDASGSTVYANRYLLDLFGWDDITGRSARELLPPDVAAKMEADDRAALEQGLVTVTEEVRDAANRARVFQTSKFPIVRAGQAPLLGGITMEVTDLRIAEQRLQAALEEKTVLLREVHHRVKNSLQAMISLMHMRDRQVADPAAHQLLVQLQEQARTMALVYEQLNQSDNLAQVRMPAYLRALASHVAHAFGIGRDVDLQVQVEDLVLDVAVASPCGLIVNELLTNALKHAFPPGFAARPRLELGLRREADRLVLVVGDNGVGLPAGLDRERSPSLGLRLVYLWATHQMAGTIQVDGTEGTRYTLVFELPAWKSS